MTTAIVRIVMIIRIIVAVLIQPLLQLYTVSCIPSCVHFPCLACIAMPVRAGATEAEFIDASYMVESVYREAEGGVFMLMTTPASNRSGRPEDWDIFFMPGATAAAVLPLRTATGPSRRIGPLGERDSRSIYAPSMREYTQLINPGAWYRIFCGYSARWPALDGEWYACDLYLQAPGNLYT